MCLLVSSISDIFEITVYPKKYAHSFVVLCFVVVMQSFIMNSHEVFIHIHQGCFAGTGAIVRLPKCQWSKPDGYGKISQCITTTKYSEAKTVCIFLGIYCIVRFCRSYFDWTIPFLPFNICFELSYIVPIFYSIRCLINRTNSMKLKSYQLTVCKSDSACVHVKLVINSVNIVLRQNANRNHMSINYLSIA